MPILSRFPRIGPDFLLVLYGLTNTFNMMETIHSFYAFDYLVFRQSLDASHVGIMFLVINLSMIGLAPLSGLIMDSYFMERMGQHRTWLMLGGFALGLSFIATWLPWNWSSNSAAMIYYTVVSLVFYCSIEIMDIASVGTVTQLFQDKLMIASANSYYMFIGSVAGVLATVIFSCFASVFDDNVEYTATSTILTFIMLSCNCFFLFCTVEKSSDSSESTQLQNTEQTPWPISPTSPSVPMSKQTSTTDSNIKNDKSNTVQKNRAPSFLIEANFFNGPVRKASFLDSGLQQLPRTESNRRRASLTSMKAIYGDVAPDGMVTNDGVDGDQEEVGLFGVIMSDRLSQAHRKSLQPPSPSLPTRAITINGEAVDDLLEEVKNGNPAKKDTFRPPDLALAQKETKATENTPPVDEQKGNLPQGANDHFIEKKIKKTASLDSLEEFQKFLQTKTKVSDIAQVGLSLPKATHSRQISNTSSLVSTNSFAASIAPSTFSISTPIWLKEAQKLFTLPLFNICLFYHFFMHMQTIFLHSSLQVIVRDYLEVPSAWLPAEMLSIIVMEGSTALVQILTSTFPEHLLPQTMVRVGLVTLVTSSTIFLVLIEQTSTIPYWWIYFICVGFGVGIGALSSAFQLMVPVLIMFHQKELGGRNESKQEMRENMIFGLMGSSGSLGFGVAYFIVGALLEQLELKLASQIIMGYIIIGICCVLLCVHIYHLRIVRRRTRQIAPNQHPKLPPPIFHREGTFADRKRQNSRAARAYSFRVA